MRTKPAPVVDLHAERRQRALAAADAKVAAAKMRFSLAALACLRNSIDAEQQVQLALRELDAVRVALREASGDA